MNEWLAPVLGLGGVIIGVLLASFFELWRRAVDGQAATRLIRVETIENRVKVLRVLGSAYHAEKVGDEAWLAYRLHAAPFLEELELSRLAEWYSYVPEVNNDLMHTQVPASRSRLEGWVNKAKENGRMLRQIEAANPISMAFRLLTKRRVATTDEIRTAFGLTGEDVAALEQE